MNMLKAIRCIALVLVCALVCGMIPAACAEVVTLGIVFSGRRTTESGAQETVRLDGRFRVMQNGEEIGVIQAGKETLTLNSTERIRIDPMPESIAPEWDLSTAVRDVVPEAGSTVTVSIVVEPLKEDASAPTPVPTAEPAADLPEEDRPAAPAVTPEPTNPYTAATAAPDANTGAAVTEYRSGPVATPTLPPFDESLVAPSPEPEWITLPEGTGKVQVLAFMDANHNGIGDENDRPYSGVTVCLLTGDEQAVTAARTGDSGYAVFENLPAGQYRIKAILPDGIAFDKKGPDGVPFASLFGFTTLGDATSDPFNVDEGSTVISGISLAKCLSVSGQCWFETTNDGLFTNEEPVLGGVYIELKGEKNGLHYETYSGADGTWKIDRVSPAAYQLIAHAPDGMMFARVSKTGGKRSVITKDGTGTASRRIDLNDNTSKANMYIGFTWAGQVTGMCFLDANYNGLYDEGEPPLAGVKITAIKQAKDEEAAVTYSGEDGTYVLTGLRENTYKMRAVLPDDGCDFTRVVSDPLGNHFEARPGRRENFWTGFVLQNAEQRQMNIGAIYPASVSGTVYMDDDFSGTLTGKEKIISGFLVKLLDENGEVMAMDKTSVKGKYELTKVPPGNYTLSVTAVKDYAFTRLGEGNVILNRTNGEGYSEPFTLGLKENRTGMDIGMIRPGMIQGYVFADKNDNGLKDPDENGLPGVTVRLIGEDGEAFSTEIGIEGSWLFDAVMPGTYHLEYTLPENAIFATVTAGGNTISGDRTGESESFEMTSGVSKEGPLCGALTLGRIEGSAYFDHDGDGTPSEGEEAAAGLTVTLTPSRDELEEITVTTGDDGVFALEALHPDEYTLSVTCPENHVLSRTDSLDLPLTAGKDTQTAKLTVAMGAVWTDQKLGTVIPAGLSGQLWLDENNNGIFDAGESTPAGYEVVVTDDRTGKRFDTLRTDENGFFATSGMIPGSFTLSFPLDEQTISSKQGDSDFREENGQLVLPGIVMGENEEREGLLLGIVRYTTIGGTVWIDRGDSMDGLPGAQIVLEDEDGNVLQTLTTTGNGLYRFEKLMPGTYRIEAEMPEGCVIIEPDDRRLGEELISVLTETLNRKGSSDLIELKMGTDRLQMNIGCVLPGRLGDLCWLDLDGDGLQGLNEPGIPGVKIVLLRDGNVIDETVSDQYGFYRFTDLYPAFYTLEVTPPAEVKPTRKRTDIPLIVSMLEEDDANPCVTEEFQVFSDKANYNIDLGFVCRREGVMPDGVGEGKTQKWKNAPVTED